MKKYLSVLFVAVFALALTGCGKGNTLTCTQKDEDGNVTEMKATIKDNNVTKVTTSETITFESADEAKSTADLYKSLQSDEMDVKVDGKKVIISVTVEKGKDDEDVSKADFKKELEEEGFTCK